jgi:RNA polymerase sigma-70 factor (TIGR02943 family)
MQDFTEHVVAMRPLLVRLARQRLRNEAWAEDAVSETLVAALEKPGAFAGRAKARTWLVGILKHKLVDQVRRHTRECQITLHDDDDEERDAFLDLTPADDAADPQHQLAQRQFVARVDACLQQLPPQQGRAFVLREWLEEETDDVCRELGVTANHLGVMIHRARRKLRATLGPQRLGAAHA